MDLVHSSGLTEFIDVFEVLKNNFILSVVTPLKYFEILFHYDKEKFDELNGNGMRREEKFW